MKRIPLFGNYSITTDGRVYSHKLRPGIVSPVKEKNGYIRYQLIDDSGKRRGIYAHQAVAQAYIANPESKPEVNHLDHDKSNNCIENLSWVTHQENIGYDWKMKTRTANYGNRKITASMAAKIRELYDKGNRQIDLADEFGLSQSAISLIVREFTWKDIKL